MTRRAPLQSTGVVWPLPTPDAEVSLRQQAARLSGHVELRDIRTFALSAVAHSLPEPNRYLRFDLEPAISYDLDEDVLVVQGEYALSIRETPRDAEGLDAGELQAANSNDDNPIIADLTFSLAALYTLRAPEGDTFSDDECYAFAQTTGQFALYPYVRQLVADLTTRLQFPPLTLPLFVLPLPNPAQADAEGDSGQ